MAMSPAADVLTIATIARVALILAAPFVAVGLFTPVVASVSGLLALSSLLGRGGMVVAPIVISGPWQIGVLTMAGSAAVALIGPGAYSADSYFFAPRKIQIPTRSPLPRL
jgi:hypothetical protein